MCRDVSFEPIGDIVDRLVNELARPGMPAQEPARSTTLLGYQRVSTLTRHSAEAELNRGAVGTGRTAPTASAQTSLEHTGRATHNAGRETGVVNLDEWRSSRALSGAGPARLPMDDGHQARGCLGDHQPETVRRGIARGAKLKF